jgi:cell division protein FtsN
VASLLSVPLRADQGQPDRLALTNFPAIEQLAAEAANRAEPLQVGAPAASVAAAPALAEAAVHELPAIEPEQHAAPSLADSSSQTRSQQLALIDLPQSAPAATVIAYRAVAKAPAAKRAAPKPVVPTVAKSGTHMVQLGSFATADGARRAWRHYTSRNPGLNGFTNVTTKVTVNGKQFWRVQAAGFGGYASASSMCGTVKSRGGNCLVLRGAAPGQPGQQRAIETRMAKR